MDTPCRTSKSTDDHSDRAQSASQQMREKNKSGEEGEVPHARLRAMIGQESGPRSAAQCQVDRASYSYPPVPKPYLFS